MAFEFDESLLDHDEDFQSSMSSLDAITSTPPPEKRTLGGTIKDVGISALKGAIGVPEAAVGIADIFTGGYAGKGAEAVGIKTGEAKEILDDQLSGAQKQANRKVQDADGFVDTLGAALSNPSTIAHTTLESAPAMLAGGAVGRGLGAIAPALKGTATAAGIGEGLVGAGMAAEGIRGQTEDGTLSLGQSGLAALTGAFTAAFGIAGGKVANKLGIGDVDVLLAGGRVAGGRNAQAAAEKGIVRRFLEGAFTEGVLEELPQSLSETALENIALGRDIMENMDYAGAMGILAGAAMGGPVAAFAKGQSGPGTPAAGTQPTVPVNPSSPNLPAAPGGVAAPYVAQEPRGPLGRASALLPSQPALPGPDRQALPLGQTPLGLPAPGGDQPIILGQGDIPSPAIPLPTANAFDVNGKRDEIQAINTPIQKGEADVLPEMPRAGMQEREEVQGLRSQATEVAPTSEGTRPIWDVSYWTKNDEGVDEKRTMQVSAKTEAEARSLAKESVRADGGGVAFDLAPAATPSAEVETAAHSAATSDTNDLAPPTDGQKAAGNYKKGHVKISGLDITIENPKGSERSGTDPDGNPWSVTMPAHYGYIKRTEGADGDQVDVYIGDDHASDKVFIVDQGDLATGKFDEHKAIIGTGGLEAAKTLYAGGFSDGRGMERIKSIKELTTDEFKTWLKTGDTTQEVGNKFTPGSTDILTSKGQPFASKAKALTAIKARQYGKTHEVVAVEGGFVGRQKAPKVKSAAQIANDAKRNKASNVVDTENDDILRAISKLGGIEHAQALSQWGNTITDSPLSKRQVFGKPIFRKNGGMPLDRMLRSLKEYGFLHDDADLNDFMEAVGASVRGEPVMSIARQSLDFPEREVPDYDPEELALYESEFSDSELEESGYNDLTDEELAALEPLSITQVESYETYRDEITSFLDEEARRESDSEAQRPVARVEREGTESSAQPEQDSQQQKQPAEEVASAAASTIKRGEYVTDTKTTDSGKVIRHKYRYEGKSGNNYEFRLIDGSLMTVRSSHSKESAKEIFGVDFEDVPFKPSPLGALTQEMVDANAAWEKEQAEAKNSPKKTAKIETRTVALSPEQAKNLRTITDGDKAIHGNAMSPANIQAFGFTVDGFTFTYDLARREDVDKWLRDRIPGDKSPVARSINAIRDNLRNEQYESEHADPPTEPKPDPLAKARAAQASNSKPSEAVVEEAKRVLVENSSIFDIIEEAAKGVVVGAQTGFDRLFDAAWVGRLKSLYGVTPDAMYDAFAATRELLRKQYGDTVPLVRLQGDKKLIDNKHTLNFATKEYIGKFEKMYSEYGEKRAIVERQVPVEDIIAVNVGKSGRYEEFVVLNRDSKGFYDPTEAKAGPLTEKTPDGDQTKLFATPPTFGKGNKPTGAGVGKNDLDFNLEAPEAGLFDAPAALPSMDEFNARRDEMYAALDALEPTFLRDATAKSGPKENRVFMDIWSRRGDHIEFVSASYDGTEADGFKIGALMRFYMEESFENVTMRGSFGFITDANGQPAWGISQGEGQPSFTEVTAKDRGRYTAIMPALDAPVAKPDPLAKAKAVQSTQESPVKHGDISVGATVYFDDAYDDKRHKAQFRGFDGNNVVLIWNGSQMSIEASRVFANDKGQSDTGAATSIESELNNLSIDDLSAMFDEAAGDSQETPERVSEEATAEQYQAAIDGLLSGKMKMGEFTATRDGKFKVVYREGVRYAFMTHRYSKEELVEAMKGNIKSRYGVDYVEKAKVARKSNNSKGIEVGDAVFFADVHNGKIISGVTEHIDGENAISIKLDNPVPVGYAPSITINFKRAYATKGEAEWDSRTDAGPAPVRKKKASDGRKGRTLDEDGRVSDGLGGILPGDTFTTATGRQTTPYPKYSTTRVTKAETKKQDQWLIDNAIAEAEARGDDFNATVFIGETAGNLHTAGVDSMNMYLFGKNQPKVVPKITRPINDFEAKREKHNDMAEEVRRLRRAGEKAIPGIQFRYAEDAGRVYEAVQNGDLTQADWDAYVADHESNGNIDKPTGKPDPLEKSKDARTASKIAAEAAKHGVGGIDQAMKGLVELFGGANSLKSFPAGMDRETYEKAKPHFEAAFKEFAAAGKSMKEFLQFVISSFSAKVKPYLMYWLEAKQNAPAAQTEEEFFASSKNWEKEPGMMGERVPPAETVWPAASEIPPVEPPAFSESIFRRDAKPSRRQVTGYIEKKRDDLDRAIARYDDLVERGTDALIIPESLLDPEEQSGKVQTGLARLRRSIGHRRFALEYAERQYEEFEAGFAEQEQAIADRPKLPNTTAAELERREKFLEGWDKAHKRPWDRRYIRRSLKSVHPVYGSQVWRVIENLHREGIKAETASNEEDYFNYTFPDGLTLGRDDVSYLKFLEKAAPLDQLESTQKSGNLFTGDKNNVIDERSDSDLERDSQDSDASDGLGKEGVRPGPGENSGASVAGVRGTDSKRDTSPGSLGLSGHETAAAGNSGDLSPYPRDREPASTASPTGSDNDQRGGDVDLFGQPVDHIAPAAVSQTAQSQSSLKDKIAEQREADSVKVVPGDRDNIDATLPFLHTGQKDDVAFAEERFAKADGYGVLFTNGTGTGKTYTGLGIIKRFVRQGKSNILIVAPDSKVISDWIESAKNLGLDVSRLEDTRDGGKGVVITTYQNLGANDNLVKRSWDLIVTDEAHNLMQGKDGKETNALTSLRAITMHPRGKGSRHSMLYRKEIDQRKDLYAKEKTNAAIARLDDTRDEQRDSLLRENARIDEQIKALDKLLNEKRDVVRAEVDAAQGASRPRVVMLSATPFAYEKSVDMAEGYLFDYPEAGHIGNSRQGGFEKFMVENFGWRIRYHKLTEPEAEVDRGLMQRAFNSKLKKAKVLAGRMLDVDQDYDRKFVLTENAIGFKIDEGMEYLWDNEQFRPLSEALRKHFDYLSRRYLLEAIKAREAVPLIKAHMALGRKVVVFHDYKKGGGSNPFNFRAFVNSSEEVTDKEGNATKLGDLIEQFEEARPDLANLDLRGLLSPVEVFTKAFRDDEVLIVNGDMKERENLAAYKRFNSEDVGPTVMLVQSAKNAGWSGHDTTGKHQRVIFNLGLPERPTMAIQQEGRIYRVGQQSNAMFRYLNTGTNWERFAFASKIAARTSAAENLALGEQARALRDAFIQGFEESDAFPAGFEGEGTGGKERDAAANQALTEWDRAMTYYFSQAKKTSRTKSLEGKDYFATPEPLGLKMVEWADIKAGDHVLEPSAGHGAIARWFPEHVDRTVIEPSSELASRLNMVTEAKLLQQQFEDHNIVNKYDVIVMNPPFGSGGSTAINHLAKAAGHLREGGRIVALIPTGPAADKKFEKWFFEEDEKGRMVRPDLHLAAVIILPRVAFERAGTSVAARIVIIDRAKGPDVSIQQQGRDYSNTETTKEFFERIEDSSVQGRPAKPEATTPAPWTRSTILGQKPNARQEAAAQKQEAKVEGEKIASTAGAEIVEYTTKKGKVLRGVVRPDLSKGQAQAIDPFTWELKRGEGYFIRIEHLAKLQEAHPVVNETGAEYGIVKEGGPQLELSFDKVPDAEGSATGRNNATGDGNVHPAGKVSVLRLKGRLPISNKTRAALSQKVDRVQTGTFQIGLDQINSPADAAHVFASLRKKAKENFVVLGLDKDNKPIAIIDISTGSINASIVHPVLTLGPVLDLPGVKSVWFGHNHPSGNSDPSREDRDLTDRLRKLLDGTGVRLAGHVVIGEGGRYATMDYSSGSATPAARNKSIPVIDDRLDRNGLGTEKIDSSRRVIDIFKSEAFKGRGDGVLFVNSKNVPVAWVDMTAAEMKLLKTGDKEGGSGLLIRTASQSGAAAMVIRSRGAEGVRPAGNVANFGTALDVRTLDIIFDDDRTSAADRAISFGDTDVFFSRDYQAVERDVKRLAERVAHLEKKFGKIVGTWKNAPELHVVQTEADLPRKIQSEIRKASAEGQVRGVFFDGNKVYMVAANIANDAIAEEVLLHEALGHYGARALFGKDYQQAMGQLYLALGGGVGIRKLAAKYGVNLNDYLNNSAHLTREDYETMMVDELLAHLQQNNVKPNLVQKVIAAIRNALRGMGFNLKMNDADLLALLGRMKDAVVKGDGGTVYTGGINFAAAWHGTPHNVDRFSSDKIGTGEGAQAYGYGLYFAGKREVAEWYRDKLANNVEKKAVKIGGTTTDIAIGTPEFSAAHLIQQYGYGGAISTMQSSIRNSSPSRPDNFKRSDEEVLRILTEWEAKGATIVTPSKGRLYAVELAPSEDEYLLWDRPLSEQSEKVQKAINDYFVGWYERPEQHITKDSTGGEIYRAAGDPQHPGDERTDAKGVSTILTQYGIRGIKYRDGTSRNNPWSGQSIPSFEEWLEAHTGQDVIDIVGTDKEADYDKQYDDFVADQKRRRDEATAFNYVIFNDQDVEITARFSKHPTKEYLNKRYDAQGGKRGKVVNDTEANYADFTDRQEAAQAAGAGKTDGAGKKEGQGVPLEPGYKTHPLFDHQELGDIARDFGEVASELLDTGLSVSDVKIILQDEINFRASKRPGYSALVQSLFSKTTVAQLAADYPGWVAANEDSAGAAGSVRFSRTSNEKTARLLKTVEDLEAKVDAAYESGDTDRAEALDEQLAEARGALEDHASQAEYDIEDESYDESSVDEQLARAYHAYTELTDGGGVKNGFASKADAIANMRSVLEEANGPTGFRSDTTDAEVLSAARDAYADRQRRSAARFSLRPVGGIGPSPATLNRASTRIKNTIDYLRMKLQDKFIPLLRAQEKFAADGWVKTNANDAYRAEELFHGKAQKRLEDFYDKNVTPLIDAIKSSSVNISELEDYLYATFAPQRNAYVASINPAMPEGGSGMTNEEAQRILDTFAADGKTAELERLAVLTREITAMQREIIRNEGLELDETMDAWEYNNPDYVPLKGGKEEKGRGVGTGFNVKRSGTKQALGRRSKADNILAHLFEQTGATIVRAEKAKVGRAFLAMAEENAGSDLLKVHTRLPMRKAKVNGIVKSVVDLSFPQNDNVLTVTLDDGSIKYVEIFDDDLARVMKNLTPGQHGKALQMMGSAVRFLSRMSTSLNPEFVITNFERDIQTAMIHLGGEHSAKLAKKVAKGVPGAMKGMHSALRGDKSHVMAGWFDRFQKAGGQISFMDLRGIEDWQKRLAAMAQGGGMSATKENIQKVFDFIGDYNSIVENAVRLSAFRQAVEAGMSESDAASLARNLTVNFNRKGELGPAINAFYMFANAGIQGSARIFSAMGKSRKVQAMMGATVLASWALAEMARLSGGDDDDGESKWDKNVTDYQKMTNLVFMGADGDTVKVRVPYGYSTFVAMGYALSDVFHWSQDDGGRSPVEAGRFLTSAFMQSFNPLGGDENLLKVLSPTLADPFLEIATNENFMGSKIAPENLPFGAQQPDSELYFRSASGVSKEVAAFMNSATGGDKWNSGAVDVSPETIDHIMAFFGGGVGRLVGRTIDLPGKIASGDATPNDVPFLRQVYQTPSSRVDTDLFYDNIQKVEVARSAMNEMPLPGRKAYGEKHPEYKLHKKIYSVRKTMSTLRKGYYAALDAGDSKKAKAIQKQMQRIAIRFNRRFNDVN